MGAPGAIQTATLPEIHARVRAFVQRWRGETRERAEKDSFWNEFLQIFGVDRRRYGVFEYLAQRYTTGRRGFIDLLVPGQMAVEHKSRAQNLNEAMDQLVDYMVHLEPRDLPHTLVVCDFHNFVVRDLTEGQVTCFTLEELPANIELFLFLAGYTSHAQHETEEAANLYATELLSRLHDALKYNGYDGHQLRVFLVRLLYILFADDTQVWRKNLFYDFILIKTAEDGSDLGRRLTELFEVLDTPYDQRYKNMDPDLKEFAYVDGGLFAETLRSPACDSSMRSDLLSACMFEWSRISPAIFGSLFQNVMQPAERRRLGAHYTSERDIMRTIRPLFLDQLEKELNAAKTVGVLSERLRRLRTFRDHLRTLRFLDPACGCGNFLMLAYRELRRLELEVLLAIRDEEAALTPGRRGAKWAPGHGQITFDIALESQVHVGQFFGIEIEEFPARIAETAMHLVDHQANLALSAAFGDYYVRLPITDSAHITVGNALRADWNDTLSADDCNYILGNPPFSGQYNRSDEQTRDLRAVWGNGYNGYLDYVTGWYIKACDYVETRPTKIAFVSTNSICQGEPVAPLWEPIIRAGFSIDFAHRTFLWTSEASGAAGVHVVIVGFSQNEASTKKPLFYYPYGGRGEPNVKLAGHINPYLVDAPDVFVRPRNRSLNDELPDVYYGSKVADGGYLLVTAEEYNEVAADKHARKYLRRFIGARELIHNTPKWCLWMPDLDPDDLRSSSILRSRLEGVTRVRRAGQDDEIRAAAARPAQFLRDKQPRTNYLAIPAHVGEARPYFPVGYFSPDVITGNHNFVAADTEGYTFALMSSGMFIAWMRGVAGRIRADLRFSKTLVWNNFPVPHMNSSQRARVIEAGQEVLEARDKYPSRSLSDLYERLAMPVALVNAHQHLDKVIDRLFAGRRRVLDDVDRLSVLITRFIEMDNAERLIPTASASPPRRRRPRARQG